MKRLTHQEFQERLHEVAKANKIFVESGITKNITHAFTLYQEMLIEEEERMLINLPTTIQGQRPITVLDEYNRPVCEECGSEMFLRIAPVMLDGVLYHTTWVCGNKDECGNEVYSEKTLREWLNILEKKEVEEDG